MHVALERENSRAVAELIRHPVYLAKKIVKSPHKLARLIRNVLGRS